MDPGPIRFHLGTLTRYYAENGGVGDSDRETDPEVIAGAVSAWRHWLNKELPHALDWDESPAAPFDSAEVGETDWGALWTLAAYAAPGRPPISRKLPKAWREDRFVQELIAGPDAAWTGIHAILPDIWMPGQHEMLFQARDLRERELWIGSTKSMQMALRFIERHWRDALDDRKQLAQGLAACKSILETLGRRSERFNLPIIRISPGTP
jgi:hypothetical protein